MIRVAFLSISTLPFPLHLRILWEIILTQPHSAHICEFRGKQSHLPQSALICEFSGKSFQPKPLCAFLRVLRETSSPTSICIHLRVLREIIPT